MKNIKDIKTKSAVTGLPLIDLTNPETFRNIEFNKRDLFSAQLGEIFYTERFRNELIMYGGEYINVKDKIHIAIVSTNPEIQPYAIRSRILDTDTNFRSPHLVNVVKMDECFSIIIYNGKKFVVASVKRIILDDDGSVDISFKVRHVITDVNKAVFPENYKYDIGVLKELGLQIMNNKQPIPQSLLARINGRSSMYSKTLVMTRNQQGRFESKDPETGKIYVLDDKCRWAKENRHRDSVQCVVMKVGFPKSQGVKESNVVRCFGEAYPENMVFDISHRNRSLIELRKRAKDTKNCKFKLESVETENGFILTMIKYGKRYLLYTYGQNNAKIGKCLLG